MAIEITKSAPKKFLGICFRCTTQFKYELSDLKMNYMRLKECIACPECGEAVSHRGVSA